jgi:hypothetical protein
MSTNSPAPEQQRSLTASNRQLSAAIELVMREWIETAGAGADPVSVRIQASAATVPALIRSLLDTVVDLAAEFDHQPRSIELDGLRPLDDGWRTWGTLGLDSALRWAGLPPVATVVAEQVEGIWSINLTIGSDTSV